MGLNTFILGQYASTWDHSSNVVVALDGDKEMVVDTDHAAQWAAWSPTGAALAYIAHNLKQPEQDGLYVVDEPGKAGKQVYAGIITPSASSARWRGLYWAANNTMLVKTIDQKFLLLNLEGKQ
jgi:Fe-S cluster biosynthesis and repair protein YggX